MVVHKVIKSKKKTENDMKIETKEKICTQTSQNGVTKKCSIYIAKKKQTNTTDINITQMMVGKQWVKR